MVLIANCDFSSVVIVVYTQRKRFRLNSLKFSRTNVFSYQIDDFVQFSGDWNPTPPPQRADMPPEVTQDLRAEPVSTNGVPELQYLQENLPGVVADVYRMKREGRRPSAKQRKQGCAEWRLYCQRWDALRIGPDGLLTMFWATNHSQPIQEGTLCPAALRQELIEEVHRQAHREAQQVLTELQLWWYWPNMERKVQHSVGQREVCQASEHGRSPDKMERREQSAERPWQMETADLVDYTPRMQPKVMVRQEKSPPFMEVSSPSSARKLTPPLSRSETDLEVQKLPAEGAPYGDTGEAPIVTNWLEAPPVRRDRLRVSNPPWLVTALPKA